MQSSIDGLEAGRSPVERLDQRASPVDAQSRREVWLKARFSDRERDGQQAVLYN